MTRKYFGTDGIRGHVGQAPITPDFMLKLGWAAGMAFRKQGKCRILIGKDTRISGYMFESALQAGLWGLIAQARERQGDPAGAAQARERARVSL